MTKDEIIQAALRDLKIDALNPMQEASLSANTEGKDIILLSPTGTGKTLAYVLPILMELKKEKGVQTLILVPSRELALQIESVFTTINSEFKICSCYGGRPTADEKKVLVSLQPSVIVGTPGRINDHLSKGNIDASTIRLLVIDEFDKSLEFGFQDEMSEVISYLSRLEKRILLSATDADEIPLFTGLGHTIKLNFLNPEILSDRVKLMKVISPQKDKLETLYKLLCTLGNHSTIVFCNHRDSVERVGTFLRSKGVYNGIFHGGMEQPDRERSLYKFRNGSSSVLVCTDLAARGLDIPEIKNVIHYHIPLTEEGYIHRNGRTARWEAEGNSYLILNEEENVPSYIKGEIQTLDLPENLPKLLQPIWVTLYIGKGKKDKLNKVDIVGFLFKKAKLGKEDIGRIDVQDHYAFAAIRRKKLKQTLNLLQGEKIKGIKTKIEEAI